MDFKTLGSSLLNTFAEDKLVEYFNRKQLNQPLTSTLELSSESLVTRNVTYKTSLSLDQHHSLEIHIDAVQLTNLSLKMLSCKYKKCLGIRVCWHFMSFESTTPIIQVKERYVKINDVQKYTISLNDVFVNYISKRTVQFDLFARFEYKEKHLGSSEVDLRDLIYFPDEYKTKELQILPTNKHKIFKRCQNSSTVGNLILRYCLKAYTLVEIPTRLDEVEVEELYHKISQKASSNTLMEFNASFVSCTSRNMVEDAGKLHISVSEFSFLRNILKTILKSELFIAQNEKEHDERIQKNEINFRRSIEEYAILSGSDPNSVDSVISEDIKVRNYDEQHQYESAVIINVISLYINEKKYPLSTGDVNEFYVEYSFLSRSGRDMETVSLPLLENRTIEYNFKRTFLIDNNNNRSDCKALGKLIKEKKAIRFMVIEEPVENVSKFQICKEVGYTEINLFELIQSEENIISDLYPVKDLNFPHEEIGYLKICVYGIQAMRSTALRVLTPHSHTFQKL